jgi:hypothetical protein
LRQQKEELEKFKVTEKYEKEANQSKFESVVRINQVLESQILEMRISSMK